MAELFWLAFKDVIAAIVAVLNFNTGPWAQERGKEMLIILKTLQLLERDQKEVKKKGLKDWSEGAVVTLKSREAMLNMSERQERGRVHEKSQNCEGDRIVPTFKERIVAATRGLQN